MWWVMLLVLFCLFPCPFMDSLWSLWKFLGSVNCVIVRIIGGNLVSRTGDSAGKAELNVLCNGKYLKMFT